MLKGCIGILVCAALPGFATQVVVHGKVTMQDGSVPKKPVTIERVCVDDLSEIREAITNAKGEYDLHVSLDGVSLDWLARVCSLRASLSGYYSTSVDLTGWKWYSDPNLPTIQLLSRSEHVELDLFSQTKVPRDASRAWERAARAADAQDWKLADSQLRLAVKIDPKFALGWHALGAVAQNLGDLDRAREAQQRALELNPKLLAAWILLGRLQLNAGDWGSALKSSSALIAADTRKRYPEAYIQRAVAQYYLRDLENAQASAEECLREDRHQDFPRAHYILGLILEVRKNSAAAKQHFEQYLAIAPRASDTGFVRDRLEHLGSGSADEIDAEMKQVVARLQPALAGDVWVPGGMKALAAIAHSPAPNSPANFFGEYCQTLVRESTPGLASGYPAYQQHLNAYLATMLELSRSGDRRDDRILITLSLDEEHRKATEHLLNLFGWKATKDGVEIGDAPADGPRQDFLAAFGVDPIAMQEALEQGRPFVIEIPSENARLAGGDAWGRAVKDFASYQGGVAAAFARDYRLARTCAGLSAMSEEASALLISGIGLARLVETMADPLWRYGQALSLSGDAAAAPGSEETWQKLAGVSPKKPAAFFRAILERDEGALAAFYYALSQADAAHQRYFTSTPQRAERFYAWYRDSGEPHWSMIVKDQRWRGDFFRDLPLDGDGSVHFPGGRAAWTSEKGADDQAILKMPALRAMLHAARWEQRRGRPLDAKSAELLAQFDAQWEPLLPYFEQMTGIGGDELESLARFTQFAAKLNAEERNAALGEWSALVEMIARGSKAGALDAASAARAFRRTCDSLASADHASKAIALTREWGGADLLRLPSQRRAGFERLLSTLNVPRLGDSTKAAAALSGIVYAATLDPDGLLVNADPGLLAKHRFATGDTLFAAAALARSNQGPGSHFSGGFAGFDEVAAKLARGRPIVESEAAAPQGESAPATAIADAEPVEADSVFRASGRLVEVYATITDSRGRYVDDLKAEQFGVSEQGRTQPIVGFESRSAEVSVALLLDTTASMDAALPSLKNAALKLVSELRAEDSVAVYSFNNAVSELQPFTKEKGAAKRAILGTAPFGETALYDALVRVNRDLAGRTGKKVIIVFTDGDDNTSTLTSQAAIQRAKGAGVPVYTIAQGEAVTHPELLKQLSEVSQATGGSAFVIHNAGEVRGVFERISQDLQHGYFFLFQPGSPEGREWHPIDVTVRGASGLKIRAREGYYPE